jgi:hypothetical protein
MPLPNPPILATDCDPPPRPALANPPPSPNEPPPRDYPLPVEPTARPKYCSKVFLSKL